MPTYHKKNIDKLKKEFKLNIVQRMATKLIPECLLECRLTTLETRRLRGDLIEVLKILNGYEDIDSNIFLN